MKGMARYVWEKRACVDGWGDSLGQRLWFCSGELHCSRVVVLKCGKFWGKRFILWR